jgi:ferredoxin-type protein NapG
VGSVVALGALAGIAWARGRAEPKRTRALAPRALRPPGALPEDRFAAACVRCGLCVQACPYGTLRLAGAGAPVATGTPYFVAREKPCYMCDGVPCAAACPTGALGALGKVGAPGAQVPDMRSARIGLAALVRPEACYSFIGAAICTSCVKACPMRGRAIWLAAGATRLGGRFTPTVNPDVCTGCGLCEKACIVAGEAAAIAVEVSA